MASPALLLLLLMVSDLFVVTVSVPPKLTNDQKEKLEETFSTIVKYVDLSLQLVQPILEILETSYPKATGAIELIHLLITGRTRENPVLTKMLEEFKSLNFKLDQYHTQQRWDSWASGVYSKPQMDIEVAWSNFLTLLKTISDSEDEDTKKRHLDEFIATYQPYEPATKMLHKLMTAQEPTFFNNLGLMLADYLNCHERDILLYSGFISSLVIKGNLLNNVYYDYKNINSQARTEELDKIQYDIATAMFNVQKYCISQLTEYIKNDVMGAIDTNMNRKELAKKIRDDLDKNHKKYVWMVVAFKTQKSSHTFLKIRNKHTLTGFTVVTKEGVSVAVASQIRGEHSKAGEVKKAMEKCFQKEKQKFLCHNVEKILQKCSETVNTIPVSQTYTAVHAFHGGAHESRTDTISEDEISKDDSDAYIYKGECELFSLSQGRFHVMIKSDEEIEKSLCAKKDCGGAERGRCDSVGTSGYVCVCNHPYYGIKCMENAFDYIKPNQQITRF